MKFVILDDIWNFEVNMYRGSYGFTSNSGLESYALWAVRIHGDLFAGVYLSYSNNKISFRVGNGTNEKLSSITYNRLDSAVRPTYSYGDHYCLFVKE